MDSLHNKKEPNDKLEAALDAFAIQLNKGMQAIKNQIGQIGTNLETLKDRVLQIEDWSRKPFTQTTVKIFLSVVEKYFHGKCPCCGEATILNKLGGKDENLELDHFKGAKWNKVTEGWPVCRGCHAKLTHGYLSRDGGWVEQAFKGFQMRVSQYMSFNNDDEQRVLFG